LGCARSRSSSIQLNDIDWRAGELTVRGKGKLHDRMPITVEVGDALSRYLREERGPTKVPHDVRHPHRSASTVQGQPDRHTLSSKRP